MASPSKEEQVLRLILENSPLKHWHFEEIVKNVDMTRAAVSKWLKRYKEEGLLRRVKEKGQFPYLTCGSENPVYIAKKRIYALKKIYQSGLIEYLLGLEGVKTAIIFGSMAKGDWYKDSDIDIFIYGKPARFDKHKYEMKLKRDIELHVFDSKKDIKKIKTGIIKNVMDGHVIKGSVQNILEATC